jgi:hypothetical protein
VEGEESHPEVESDRLHQGWLFSWGRWRWQRRLVQPDRNLEHKPQCTGGGASPQAHSRLAKNDGKSGRGARRSVAGIPLGRTGRISCYVKTRFDSSIADLDSGHLAHTLRRVRARRGVSGGYVRRTPGAPSGRRRCGGSPLPIQWPGRAPLPLKKAACLEIRYANSQALDRTPAGSEWVQPRRVACGSRLQVGACKSSLVRRERTRGACHARSSLAQDVASA